MRNIANIIVISALFLIVDSQGEPAECPRYKDLGWCTQDHVKRICKIACAQEDPSCPNYKRLGWCTQHHIKNNCKASCAGSSSTATWRNWGSYSTCTKNCGGGISSRFRTCSIPGSCVGQAEQIISCNQQACPPTWGPWGPWSTCSLQCGGGSQQRHRSCLVIGQCSGASQQSRVCNDQPCSTGWLDWEQWSECNKACGSGTQTRHRICSTSAQCSGNSQETKTCNLRSCTTETAYSPCSRTCGDGVQQKLDGTEYVTRHCKVKDCNKATCGSGSETRYKNDFSCCTTTSTCNRPAVSKRSIFHRIIGGTSSAKGDWPWMVYITRLGKLCGGSLISSKFVLTAAHCQETASGMPIAANLFTATIGYADLNALNKPSYSFINSIIHPDYNFPNHDIGLLELKDHIQFSDYIQPLCLPHGEQVPHDTICIAMGWGVSYIGSNVRSDILQNVEVKVFNPNVCIHGYSQYPIFSDMLPFFKGRGGYICAGDLVNQKDSCSGDSGSPLACQRCANCGWYAAGVVSYGPLPCANIKLPGIYTKVVDYEQWIYHVTGIPKENWSC